MVDVALVKQIVKELGLSLILGNVWKRGITGAKLGLCFTGDWEDSTHTLDP